MDNEEFVSKAVSVSDLFMRHYVNVYKDEPLLNAIMDKWRKDGYSEDEILCYSQMYQMTKTFRDIDWLNPKESLKEKVIMTNKEI